MSITKAKVADLTSKIRIREKERRTNREAETRQRKQKYAALQLSQLGSADVTPLLRYYRTPQHLPHRLHDD
jgi:hypothetical protein